MSRGPLRFKETDVRRFLRAFTKEGLPVEVTLDLERGSITAIPRASSEDVMACSFVFGNPLPDSSPAGQEHGRTIPLADIPGLSTVPD